jgi:hypothetical protein
MTNATSASSPEGGLLLGAIAEKRVLRAGVLRAARLNAHRTFAFICRCARVVLHHAPKGELKQTVRLGKKIATCERGKISRAGSK